MRSVLLTPLILTNKLLSHLSHLSRLGHGLKLTCFALIGFAPSILSAATFYDLKFALINNGTEYSVAAINSSSITGTLVIPDTYNNKPVTHIKDWGFANCESLTSVTLPNTITSIGDYAFYLCTSISTIALSDELTSIGQWAFYSCNAVTSLTLPDTLTYIGPHAFYVCRGLTSITLPNALTSIEEGTFLFCVSLTSITLPDTLTYIGVNAFYGCNSLASMTFLREAPTLEGSTVFYNAGRDVEGGLVVTVYDIYQDGFANWPDLYPLISLNIVKAPDIYYLEFTLINNDTEYSVSAKYPLHIAGAIDIPATYKGKPVTAIGESGFADCSGLTSITVPDSITSIGENAFSGCTFLISITLPDSITSIGDGAFSYCPSLTSIVLPKGLTTIGDGAFLYCTSLSSITVPDELTTIGDNAFNSCESLTTITLPDTLTSIGASAFDDCHYLSSMTFLGEAPTLEGSTVFENAGRDVEVGLVVTVYDIYQDGFATWPDLYPLISLNIVKAPDIYYLEFTLINNDTEYSVSAKYPLHIAGAIEIPATYKGKPVTAIGESGFTDCESLTSINLPDSITFIGDNAFRGCSSLTTITLPDTITSIGEDVFRDCSSLTSIVLPDALTSIGASAFAECSSLTSINLPNSITAIGKDAFRDCRSLTSITLPDALTSIQEGTFIRCSSLTSINLPDTLTSVGEAAFKECYTLASLTFLVEAPVLEGSSVFENEGRDVEGGLVVTVHYDNKDGFATWPDLYPLISLNIIGAPVVVTSFTTEASYDLNHNSFSIISKNEVSGATVFLQHTDSLHEAWATLESSDYTETEDSDAGTVTRSVTLDPETKPQGYYRLFTE